MKPKQEAALPYKKTLAQKNAYVGLVAGCGCVRLPLAKVLLMAKTMTSVAMTATTMTATLVKSISPPPLEIASGVSVGKDGVS